MKQGAGLCKVAITSNMARMSKPRSRVTKRTHKGRTVAHKHRPAVTYKGHNTVHKKRTAATVKKPAGGLFSWLFRGGSNTNSDLADAHSPGKLLPNDAYSAPVSAVRNAPVFHVTSGGRRKRERSRRAPRQRGGDYQLDPAPLSEAYKMLLSKPMAAMAGLSNEWPAA